MLLYNESLPPLLAYRYVAVADVVLRGGLPDMTELYQLARFYKELCCFLC